MIFTLGTFGNERSTQIELQVMPKALHHNSGEITL